MKSKKRKMKWYTPLSINVCGILFGTTSIIIGISCANVTYVHILSFSIKDIFCGIGASFVAGAILNMISDYKIGNLLIQLVLKGVYETAASARYIRYDQRIEFTIKDFSEDNGEIYLKIDCTHSYRLHNEFPFGIKVDIDTFNDLNILSKGLNERLSSGYKTQFNEVRIEYSGDREEEIFSPSNPKHKDKFKQDEYNRPSFSAKNIRIDARNGNNIGWLKISYEISNAHCLKDNHYWYFQELSYGLNLIVKNETTCPNRYFSLIFNHPNKEEIESYNIESISKAGQLEDATLKDGEQYLSIETNFVFLPYQGFSIQWDLEEYAKSLRKKEKGAELTKNVT
jgi:hypothetical protein